MPESDNLVVPAHLETQVNSHRGKGCILDSNLLLLVAVGHLDVRLISDLPQTSAMNHLWPAAQAVLATLGQPWIITPNVATEVNGLIRKVRRPDVHPNLDNTWSARRFDALAATLNGLAEQYVPSVKIIAEPTFRHAGLTDTSLLLLAQQSGRVVFTADGKLTKVLERAGLDFINIWHFEGRPGQS